ncbi:MAG: inosine/xanthosine triphosphatase [Candidatus Paceibacterota bacterium]|jgi:inosine/xanthosine triphosphatase
MKIVVGSKNPVKVNAVKDAFKKVFGDCEVVGVSVSSGVSNMPMSFEEALRGARNRAKNAIKILRADFSVGLEGGFEKKEGGTFLTGIVAIVDKNGIWGISRGGGLLMPERIVKRVENGKELGEVMDEVRGLRNTKEKDGAVGFFTKNLIPRKKSFEISTIYALSRFIRKELFM